SSEAMRRGGVVACLDPRRLAMALSRFAPRRYCSSVVHRRTPPRSCGVLEGTPQALSTSLVRHVRQLDDADGRPLDSSGLEYVPGRSRIVHTERAAVPTPAGRG